MGDPRRLGKKYTPPKHPWQKVRIEEEKRLKKDFGLKNKKEIWRAEAKIRKYHEIARKLVGEPTETRTAKEEGLIQKLQRLGLLKESATLDDVLSIRTEDILDRRLQTIVWKKGLANTINQARQLITHGHILVKGRKNTAPSMVLDLESEKTVDWYGEPVKTLQKTAPEAPAPKPAETKTPPETAKTEKEEAAAKVE